MLSPLPRHIANTLRETTTVAVTTPRQVTPPVIVIRTTTPTRTAAITTPTLMARPTTTTEMAGHPTTLMARNKRERTLEARSEAVEVSCIGRVDSPEMDEEVVARSI